MIKTNWMFIGNTLILDFSISPKKGPKQTTNMPRLAHFMRVSGYRDWMRYMKGARCSGL